VRVVIADPPAFTPWYDHELATALGRAGAEVELVTSHFRFAELPVAIGYGRTEQYYRLSSRLFKRSAARLPLKAVEHLGVARSLGRIKADVLHLQWLGVPKYDVRIRFKSPTVFTAHDLLPRRTAGNIELWRRLLGKFDRVIVHSERGKQTLAELGVSARVLPHPVYPSAAVRADDGHTLLALGVIRRYKGLPDAIEVTRRIPGTRLLVAGDPAMPLTGMETAPRVDWRLGYLNQQQLDQALSETTLALFPYRPELDQSGALLQALGAGVPAVVYDVAGLGDPIRQFGAGSVVPAGDVDAMTAATQALLENPTALAAARAGAEKARATLTWDAFAAQHLALYRELA
jgi:glycosyltransferase involved in cell wall biosynthesis